MEYRVYIEYNRLVIGRAVELYSMWAERLDQIGVGKQETFIIKLIY